MAALVQCRHASKAVRLAIHAPLMPIRTSTSGTTQQTDAPMAASDATRIAGVVDLGGLLDMGA